MGFRYRLAEPNLPDLHTFRERLEEIWDSRYLTGGDIKERLEGRLAELLRVKHVILVSSGTLALELLLRAIRLTYHLRNDLVILPDYTFVATLNAVLRAGFRPIIVDVSPEHWALDERQVERALRETRASIALTVDPFGVPSPYRELRRIAEEHEALLIADSCEAFGATYAGMPLGSQASAHVFSFSPTKLVTAGEGGAVATDSSALAEAIRSLASHGVSLGAQGLSEGCNARISELSCLLLELSLGRLEDELEIRKQQQELYRGELERLGFSFQVPPREALPVPTYTVTRFKRPTASLIESLRREGIEVKAYFPPISELSGISPLYPTQTSKELYLHSMALPTGRHLSLDDVREIVKVIRELIG